MATVALSAIAQASALASDGGWAGPSPSSLEDEGFQQWIEDGLEEAGAIRDERHPAAEADEREASASAFEDLDPAQSRALFAGSFPLLVGLPSWDGPALPEGTEVVQYQGTSSALIAPEGSPLTATGALESGVLPTEDNSEVGVLQSTLPLRARTEQGVLRPVDPSLESHQDHFEPTNAEVEAQVPRDLSDGIELSEADIVVTPAGANGAGDAVVMGPDKLFYSGVAEDTDFIATPTALGVETFLQLRSGQSPEHSSLKLEMLQGAELIQSEDEAGARIEGSDGEVIATVLPPTATDADGMAVPAAMTVSGDRLELEIDHQGGDWRYPLILDPQVAYTWSGAVGQTPETTCASPAINGDSFWNWATNAPSRIGGGCVAGTGIVNLAFGGQSYYYNNNDFAQWTWTAPPHTYISSAGLQYSGFNNPNNSGACTVAGIYAPSLGGGMPSWQSGDPVYCWNFSGLPNRPYGIPSTAPPHPNNSLVMQLIIPCTTYPCTRQQSMANWSQGASVVLNDDDVPQITSGTNQSSVWVDDSVSGQRQEHHYVAAATDLGLGVKHFWLQTPEGTTGYTRNCDGTMPRNPGDPVQSCISPREWSKDIGYYLPEGKSPVTVWAFDQDAKYSTPKTWTELVDRSAPVITDRSGSLFDRRARIDSSEGYELALAATDSADAQQPTTDTELRAGVARIEVYVDNEVEPRFKSSAPCNQVSHECPWRYEAVWDVHPAEFEDGTHTIHVEASDALGHKVQSGKDFQITVKTPRALPQVQLVADAPDELGNTTVTVHVDGGSSFDGASPPNPYGPGIASIQIFLDGVPIGAPISAQGSCPEGGCDMDYTFQLGPSQSLQFHQLSVSAEDRGDGSDTAIIGANRMAYRHFGFNDAFFDTDDPTGAFAQQSTRTKQATTLRARTQRGGANIARAAFAYRQSTADLVNALYGFEQDNSYWASSHGGRAILQPLPVFQGGPAPLDEVDPATYDLTDSDPTNDDPDDAETYLEQYQAEVNAVAEINCLLPSVSLAGIEVWNEPNLQPYWESYSPDGPDPGNDPEWDPPTKFDLARLVHAAYEGLQDASCGGPKLVLPSLSPYRYRIGQNDRGLGPHGRGDSHYVDAVALTDAYMPLLHDMQDHPNLFVPRSAVEANAAHLYSNFNTKLRGSDGVLPLFQSYMNKIRHPVRDAYGESDPIDEWITEVGFPSTCPTTRSQCSTSLLRPDAAVMTDPDIDVDANEDPVEVAAFVPTQVKQFSRSVAAFTEFWSRPHLSAWIIHRFYDDGVPFDNQNEDPNAGKDGQEEGNFGVWPTWDGSVPKAASPTRKLYCKLNRLEGNPDAPYAALTEPYQNPAVTAPQAQLPDEAVCSE